MITGQRVGLKANPEYDLGNSLLKINGKCAYVGVILYAAGIAEFFSPNVEDMAIAHLACGEIDF